MRLRDELPPLPPTRDKMDSLFGKVSAGDIAGGFGDISTPST